MRTPETAIKGMAGNGLLRRSRRGQRRRALVAVRHCHWRGDQFSGARDIGLAGGAGVWFWASIYPASFPSNRYLAAGSPRMSEC